MLELALSYIRRGWYVFPCKPESKLPMTAHGDKDATLDEGQVRAWWTKTPNANIAIAPGPSKLTVLDIDAGLDCEGSIDVFLSHANALAPGGFPVPLTYAVRTGRRPEYRVQLYFMGNADVSSCNGWRLHGFSGDLRASWGYVMAPGSIHPESKETYQVLWDQTPWPVPEWVRGLRANAKENAKVLDDGGPITSNRNNALTSIAGKLRNAGLSRDAIEAALLQTNADRCAPPLEDEEVKQIARHAADWKLPEPDPIVTIGKGVPNAAPLTPEDADELESAPRPAYPDEVWEGTPYGEFAEICTRDNYIPKKFFTESMRTVVGAIVGDRLRCPLTGVNPRAYTIKIAPPGSGKGTSDEYIRLFFCHERWDGLERTEAPLLWTNPAEFIWRGRGIGAQGISPASAPGLIKAIEERKVKKGDTVNPLEAWKPMPRVITMSEEVRSLFANFANESTGAGLESVLCELFDRDSFTSTATKDRGPATGKLMYSLLGGITKAGWDSVFSKVESVESGFLSRVNIIGTEEDRTKAGLTPPDFTTLRNKFLPVIQALEKTPRIIDAAPSAMALMDKWYAGLSLPEGISRARLNIHAWRTALHLAWLRGHGSILEADVDGGIKVAEYQAKMREFYAPPEGETRQARCEAAIRKVMRSKRRVKLRDLRRETNANRYGIGLWDKALQSLERAGELRVAEGERKGSKVAILLKTMD